MKKREPLLIHMEILASLFDSPKNYTRLAQACNLQWGRLEGYTTALQKKGLIATETLEGQTLFRVTEEGYRVYRDWLEIWRRLPLD